MNSIQIFPSLFAAPQLKLQESITALEHTAISGWHIDIIDFHFASNLALNFLAINEIQHTTKLPLFVHLMVEHPGLAAERLKLKKGDLVVHHVEAKVNHEHVFAISQRQEAHVGLAISPSTDLALLKPYLDQIRVILVMGVQPGFSGQKPLPDIKERVSAVKELVGKRPITLAVDGGVTEHSLKALSLAGAEIFCVGSALFATPNWAEAVQALHNAAK